MGKVNSIPISKVSIHYDVVRNTYDVVVQDVFYVARHVSRSSALQIAERCLQAPTMTAVDLLALGASASSPP